MFQDYGYYMVGMHAFWWIFWIILVVSILFSRSVAGAGRSVATTAGGRHRMKYCVAVWPMGRSSPKSMSSTRHCLIKTPYQSDTST